MQTELEAQAKQTKSNIGEKYVDFWMNRSPMHVY